MLPDEEIPVVEGRGAETDQQLVLARRGLVIFAEDKSANKVRVHRQARGNQGRAYG